LFDQPKRRLEGRLRAARSVARILEPFEPRLLLAAAAAAIPSDLVDRVDTDLYQAAADLRQTSRPHAHRDGLIRWDADRRVDAYIHTATDPAKLLAKLKNLGVDIRAVDRRSRTVHAWVPAAALDNLARQPFVASIGKPDYPVANIVTSAGDTVLLTDQVRARFAQQGITGSGIKIGVISDGANNLASVPEELPANVTVHPGHAGSGNEGTAMLEIVHDLAPGAQLYFSGPASSVDMVTSINYLVAQGCDVIVDDLIFFGEPYFADGPVAQAAQNAVNAGVVYVTAAGNFGNNSHYQASYSDSGTAFNRGHLHQFAPGETGDAVDIPAGSSFRAFLQWSEAFNDSGSNYDLYLYNADTNQLLAGSAANQNGNDDPFELLDWDNTTGGVMHGEIRINKRTSAPVRELELFTIGNTSMAFQTGDDMLVGQEAVPGVISVAAVPASFPNTIETYSSHGGSTVYTSFSTQTKLTRQTLDGAAVDGVQTRIGQLGIWPHNPFFGTSAAAPHAAAIAALLLQARPTLTPAQVAQVMADTATDLGPAGYDTIYGAGRYNALDAVYSVLGAPAAPDLSAASDTGVSDSDDLTRIATPTFTGIVPAGSYVRLLVDGVSAGGVQLPAGQTAYAVQPDAPLTDGPHQVAIRIASGQAVALANNSAPSSAIAVTIDTSAPTIAATSFSFDAPGQRLAYTFDDAVVLAAGAGDPLTLDNLTTAAPIPAASLLATFVPANAAAVTFGFPNGALPDGDYHAALVAGALTDAAGNPLVVGPGFDFTVLAGDVNHDRTVDFNDLVVLAQHYNGPAGALWADGDFTADGLVDFNDLVALAQNYNRTLNPPPPPPPDLQTATSSFLVAAALPQLASEPADGPIPVFSTTPIRKATAAPARRPSTRPAPRRVS
jgi:hypothetical protein